MSICDDVRNGNVAGIDNGEKNLSALRNLQSLAPSGVFVGTAVALEVGLFSLEAFGPRLITSR